MTTNGSTDPLQNHPDSIIPYTWDLKNEAHIMRDIAANTKLYPDVLHVIGNTPLIKLNNIPRAEGIECDMYAKCEFLNPGGSVKDRIGYRMVLDAESKGLISPERKSVLIEPTSGNTGIGIALAAAIRGYRCIIVLPEKMSDEKVNTLTALGAEIVRTPTEAAFDDPASNIMVAQRLNREIPNSIVLNQYQNVGNPLAHYDGTGEEILWSLDGDVDMVVLGAGTGGTISGTAHKIKERCPGCAVVAVDPYGSILSIPAELNQTDVSMYEVEGIGYDFIPKVLDRGVVDEWIKTDDKTSLQLARRLIKEEGLLCGGSSGAAMSAALQAARRLRAGQRCVVLLPDGMRNYMTKFISDPWLEARHMKPVPERPALWWWGVPVSKLPLVAPPPLAHTATAAEALAHLDALKLDALPVVDDNKSVIGVFTSDHLRKRVANHGASPSGPVDQLLVKKFYQVDLNGVEKPTLGFLSRVLDVAPFAVVVNSGNAKAPIGIVNSSDLMHFVTSKSQYSNGN